MIQLLCANTCCPVISVDGDTVILDDDFGGKVTVSRAEFEDLYNRYDKFKNQSYHAIPMTPERLAGILNTLSPEQLEAIEVVLDADFYAYFQLFTGKPDQSILVGDRFVLPSELNDTLITALKGRFHAAMAYEVKA